MPPASIEYEHPRDEESFKNGFEDGSLDAQEGVLSLCAAKKCRAQNPYERGYTLGYKKGARQNKSHFIDPLIDSPGKTMGSDFNGDGIHDVIIGAYLSEGAGAPDSGRGDAYVFFGATTLSGTKTAPNTDADVVIFGKAAGDILGYNGVASAGDVNGDGIDDIIVGAHQNNDGGGANNAGAAYIFFGATTLSGTKNLKTTASADVTILGKAASDSLGFAVSSAGDVNGDGFDDVIIGAHADDVVAVNAGAAYIFFGAGNLSGTKDLGGTASADVTILGKVGSDFLGRSVSGAGDINGDGFDDIIVGAYGNDAIASLAGEAYIFFGASNLSGTKNLDTTASPDVTMQGKAQEKRLGFSVSGAGDVNGDGFDDVTISSHTDGASGPGQAYIFYGSSSISGTKSANSANVEFLGKSNVDQLSFSVSGAGDVNDDGFDDVIVGARYDDSGGTNRGAAFVFFGASDLSGTKNLATTASADVTILGLANSDELGKGVSSAGDVNGDGIADFIAGADNNDSASDRAGAAYIFFGATTLSGTTKNLGGGQSADVTVTGQAAVDYLGKSVGGGRSSSGP